MTHRHSSLPPPPPFFFGSVCTPFPRSPFLWLQKTCAVHRLVSNAQTKRVFQKKKVFAGYPTPFSPTMEVHSLWTGHMQILCFRAWHSYWSQHHDNNRWQNNVSKTLHVLQYWHRKDDQSPRSRSCIVGATLQCIEVVHDSRQHHFKFCGVAKAGPFFTLRPDTTILLWCRTIFSSHPNPSPKSGPFNDARTLAPLSAHVTALISSAR